MIWPPQMTSRDFVLMAAITVTLARLCNFTSFSGLERIANATGTGCVLVWTASHPRGLMALLASQKDERKV